MLDELDDVRHELQDAETGQRGYIITGEERYLEPYRSAVGNIPNEIRSLRALTAGNPERRLQIDRLQRLVLDKFAELDETIDLRKDEGFRAALEVVRTDKGKKIMDELRALARKIETEEIEILESLDQRAETRARDAIWTILVATLLAFGVVTLASLVIHRDIIERKRAQEDLQKARDDLERRVVERTRELAVANEELQSEIAERKRVEERLAVGLQEIEKSHQDMISILNHLRLGTVTTDENGKVVFISRVAQRLFHRSEEMVLGRPWQEVFPFEEREIAKLRERTAQSTGSRTKMPVSTRSGESTHYWMEVEVQDDPRHPQRKIFIFYDVSELYDLRRLLSEKTRFRDLVGKSRTMHIVYQQMRDVAKIDWTVLIEGATGTGKELVARAIHDLSGRKAKPFIAVNCAGLTESLLGSQLFGHRRGAFTGAVSDQVGLFEAADAGTVFLDEIGDIPPSVQTSLLRVLQEREIVRLGETKPRKIDVRIIAATQHDLTDEVAHGSFRPDLLYRIRVARIDLPPLRERGEDIPLLVAHFLGLCRATTGKPLHEVSSDAMRCFVEYAWPGNVRELKSAVEVAALRCRGSVIKVGDLPREMSPWNSSRPDSPDAAQDDEVRRIRVALEQAKGNRTRAASLLGVSRATLYRRLAVLGISAKTVSSAVSA
ncbi:MAG: sigma 54-interacting transcriptional regulator [Gammaproteobacteria bacterium]